jgi:hypothetical protein
MLQCLDLEFPMPRRLKMMPLAILLPLLGGCAALGIAPQAMSRPHSGQVQSGWIQGAQGQAGQGQGRFYECRLMSQGVATPGPDMRLMLRSLDVHGQLPLRVDQDDWQSLDVAAGSKGLVFNNSSYAWRFNRTGGVLTDIRNIETYDCTFTSGAAGQPG